MHFHLKGELWTKIRARVVHLVLCVCDSMAKSGAIEWNYWWSLWIIMPEGTAKIISANSLAQNRPEKVSELTSGWRSEVLKTGPLLIKTYTSLDNPLTTLGKCCWRPHGLTAISQSEGREIQLQLLAVGFCSPLAGSSEESSLLSFSSLCRY